MSRISDAQQARPVPAPKPVDLHGQDLDLLPIVQLVHSFAQIWSELAKVGAECIQAARFDLVIGAFCDDEARLKIIRSIDQDQRLSVVHVSEHLGRIVRACG